MAFRRFMHWMKNSSISSTYLREKSINYLKPGARGWASEQSSQSAAKVLPFLFGVGLCGLSLSSLSPVHALWGTKSEDKSDSSGPRIKLRNKNDAELLNDIKIADRTYVVDEGISQEQVYKLLSKHKDKNEPELLWRLARITYELSKKSKSEEKKRLINEAFETIQKALELDETNFAVHKWMAILLNARSTLVGTKEQITQSYNVRKHMERAAELNPKDATSIYLIGNWCYTVAEIPWYQKKIAATIFATPPSCSFSEAVEHFLKAESTEPHFYSMNLLMLAKSYLRLGDAEKAEMHLLELKGMPTVTDEDYKARQEGRELLDQILRSRKTKEGKPQT